MKSVLISAIILILAGLFIIFSNLDLGAENLTAIVFIIFGSLVIVKGVFGSKPQKIQANRE